MIGSEDKEPEISRQAQAERASEPPKGASERVERLIFSELDAVALGLEATQEHVERVALPDLVRGPLAPCVLCGFPSLWRSERNGASVHRRCIVAYLEERQ